MKVLKKKKMYFLKKDSQRSNDSYRQLYGQIHIESWAFLVAQLIKNSPAMQETWVQSLGWEDPLEKGKTTHSSILSWRIPWNVQSVGSKRVRYDKATFTFIQIATERVLQSNLTRSMCVHRKNRTLLRNSKHIQPLSYLSC